MSTANLDSADLKAVSYGGLINEDVMQEIFMIDPIDRPYMDMAGDEDSKNEYKEWTQDSLAAPDLSNAVVDGADASGNQAATGARLGNHHQQSDKVVRVSDRARNSDTIGRSDELVYQLMQRQKELYRDMEAILLSNQGSVADDGNTVPGKTAGCGAMFKTNITNGTTAGFANGLFPAPTPGAATALTETMIRAGMAAAYTEGGDPRFLMSVPRLIGALSEYLFTSSARIATLQKEAGQVAQGKYGHQGVTAVGAVNVFVTDYGTLTLVPNRIQQTYAVGGATSCANMYGFDPDYWAVSYLQRVQTKPLARTGTAENRQMVADYCNVAKQEASSFVLMGIDTTLPVAA
jgi:hypothetical protein